MSRDFCGVYIYAPYEVRLKNCVEYFGMTGKEAVRAVNEADKAREHYHKKVYPRISERYVKQRPVHQQRILQYRGSSRADHAGSADEVWGDIKFKE